MDPLVEYIRNIYSKNHRARRFVISIAKVVEDLNTKVFIPDHNIIVDAINIAINVPHNCIINGARTHIEVDIIGN